MESEDSAVGGSIPPGAESPFLPIRCFDHDRGGGGGGGGGPQGAAGPHNNLGVKKDPYRDGGGGGTGIPPEPKRSPKLEHKAVTRVKSMMSIECPSGGPQRHNSKGEENANSSHPAAGPPPTLHHNHSPTGTLTRNGNGCRGPLHCRRGEPSELAGVCTIETVVLRRSESESFGLDLEIKSSPLKVVVTGLRAGGAAERVRTVSVIVSVSVCLSVLVSPSLPFPVVAVLTLFLRPDVATLVFLCPHTPNTHLHLPASYTRKAQNTPRLHLSLA